MPELMIILSLVAMLAAYILVVLKDKSFVNILTPVYFTFIPTCFILELIHIHYNGYSGSTFAYLFSYSAYALYFIVLALVYRSFPSRLVRLPFNVKSRIRFLPYIILGLSLLVYLPLLVEFREMIFSPRDIYHSTRSGYGHIYFVSAMLTFVAFILMLFKKPGFRGEKLLFFGLTALVCMLHGSKSHLVILGFYALLHQVYVKEQRAGLARVIKLTAVVSIAIGSLFYFLSSWEPGDVGLLRVMSNYSDYTRNAMMVIDDDAEPLYGRLTFEQTVYSRVPRVLYPDKPKDWGGYYLAQKYYPVWHEKEIGSPSFGMIGVPYADFGVFSLIYLLAWAAVIGALLRIFVVRLQRYRSVPDFIMVAFLAGVIVIPSGTGYTLPEHFVLALIVAWLLRLKLTRRVVLPVRAGTGPNGTGA